MKTTSQAEKEIQSRLHGSSILPAFLSIFVAAFTAFPGLAFAQNVPVTQGFSQPVVGLQSIGTLDNFLATNVVTTNALSNVFVSQQMNLSIGLPLHNQDALENLLQQLSDPTSTNYQQYLTPDQFTSMFGPTPDDYQAVIDFVQANGLTVTGTYSNRMILDVSGTISAVENTFGVTMLVYQNPSGSNTFYAPDVEPAIPPNVPILGIEGINNFAQPQPAFQLVPPGNLSDGSNAGSGPSGEYGGKDFRKAYLPDLNATLNGSGQTVGLLEFDGYFASDITAYENLLSLNNVPLQNVLVDGFNGQPSGTSSQIEVSLDIEMAISMAPNLSQLIIYEAPGTSYSTGWYDILNTMASPVQGVLPKQLSCSWFAYSRADVVAENIFKRMAAQGQSFFAASGDSDAYCAANPYEGELYYLYGSDQIPFPCDSPDVTLVGGTTLTTSGPGGSWVSENVWNWGFYENVQIGSTVYSWYQGSSGGISSQYSIPSWQTGLSTPGNQGSATSRNVPDVALTANNVAVYEKGGWVSGGVGGTSCAAPLWAGVTALVNQQAIANGHSSVGFINPAIYTLGKGSLSANCFHDITAGNNYGSCGSEFSAVSGYDLGTGWGTPKSQTLIFALAGPSVPTGLNATPGCGLVALSWSAASGAASYNIYRSTSTGGPYTKLNPSPITATTYSDTSGACGTTYYYEVTAVLNGVESANSSPVSAAPLCVPAPPAGLTATPGNARVGLSWTASSGATSYNIKRSTTSGSGYITIGSSTGLTYTDTGLNNGTTYYYVVSAVNSCGESANSSPVGPTPQAPPWTLANPLNIACRNHTATLLNNGQVLVAGGYNSGSLQNSELYNPSSGGWTTTRPMVYGQTWYTATLLTSGLVLAAGGDNYGGQVSELYNPVAGTWQLPPVGLNTGRQYHTATLLPNGQVLVTGGQNGASYLSSAELYNPTSPSWAPTSPMHSPRMGHTATLLPNGQVLVTGGAGSNGPLLASAELYNPANGTWTVTNPMQNPRIWHTATLLANGKVLVTGGVNINGPLSIAELFDPGNGTWTTTGSMHTPRMNQTATLLLNGQVLVAGGSYGSPLTSTELYNPNTTTWTVTSPLNNARQYHTATLLPNGQVMVTGGLGFNGLLTSVELYTP